MSQPALPDAIRRVYLKSHLPRILFVCLAVLSSLLAVHLYAESRISATEDTRSAMISAWGAAASLSDPQLAVQAYKITAVNVSDDAGGSRAVKKLSRKLSNVYVRAAESDVKAALSRHTHSESGQYVERYALTVTQNAIFRKSDLESFVAGENAEFESLRPESLRIIVPFLSTNRHIEEVSLVSLNDVPLEVRPWNRGAGFSASLNLVSENSLPEEMRVKIVFSLKGSESLEYTPTAAASHLVMSGNGSAPYFTGDFLPRSVRSDAQGFAAEFFSNRLATGVSSFDTYSLSLGMKSFSAVFSDSSSDARIALVSVRYMLFYGTMMCLALMCAEILSRTPVHLLQYGVFASVCPVASLLVFALSEHLSFTLSMCLAGALTSALSAAYVAFVLKGVRSRLVAPATAAASSLLLAMCYSLVIDESFALPVLTATAVLLLALVMYATSRSSSD